MRAGKYQGLAAVRLGRLSDIESRARNADEAAEPEYLVDLAPGYHLDQRISAGYEIGELTDREIPGNLAQRLDRVGSSAPPDLHVACLEPILALNGEANHRQPFLRGRDRILLFVWRGEGGDEEDAPKVQPVARHARGSKVPEVNVIHPEAFHEGEPSANAAIVIDEPVNFDEKLAEVGIVVKKGN